MIGDVEATSSPSPGPEVIASTGGVKSGGGGGMSSGDGDAGASPTARYPFLCAPNERLLVV